MSAPVRDLAPAEAAELRRSEPDLCLLDVRGEDEWAAARIEGAHLLGPALGREILDEWPRDVPILVYCHHGIRSRFAADNLRRAGFTRLYNLAGGIEAWSRDVDPSVPHYSFLPGEGLVVG